MSKIQPSRTQRRHAGKTWLRRLRPDAMTISNRLAMVIITSAIAVVTAVFLIQSPVEFPLDDAYIHFVYAKNLSEHGGLFFNDANETGVGTSSILWVLLLAGGDQVGLPMHAFAKLLGIGSLMVVSAGVPSVLIPFYYDQPFWGNRVYRLGAGPRPIARTALTAESLAAAIRAAVGDPGIRACAAALGRQIRSEDGVARAVEIFHRHPAAVPTTRSRAWWRPLPKRLAAAARAK